MKWEQVEPGWYVCRNKDGRSLGAVYREAPSKWHVYVTTDKFPGDCWEPTLWAAKAIAERLIGTFRAAKAMAEKRNTPQTFSIVIRPNGTLQTIIF
jgi:hypothetical protein